MSVAPLHTMVDLISKASHINRATWSELERCEQGPGPYREGSAAAEKDLGSTVALTLDVIE